MAKRIADAQATGAQNCVIRWGMRLEKTPKTPTLAGGEDVQALLTFPCWGQADKH